MRNFKRSKRIADQIKREVSQIVSQSAGDSPVGMITVTDVTVTDDLRYAKIFVSALGDSRDGELASNYLNDIAKSIRSALASRIRMKFIPEIRFEYDPSILQGMRIESILKDLKKDDLKDSES